MQFIIGTKKANENILLFNAQLAQNFAALGAAGLPDDFKFIVCNDLTYTKKNGEKTSYWGLVPFFNGAEHLELAITQFDLLLDNCPEYNYDGTLKGFWQPSDALHVYARQTASPSITYKDWLDGIAAKFNKDYKVVLLNYTAKTLKGAVYNRVVWGLEPKDYMTTYPSYDGIGSSAKTVLRANKKQEKMQ